MRSDYITFRSVTVAQRGERLLRSGGIDCVLQRTPPMDGVILEQNHIA